MHYRALHGFVLTSAMVLVGCAQDRTDGPALPTSVARSLSSVAPSCNFTTIRSNATGYFSSSTDPVFGLISAMESAVWHAGDATGAGFNVLARVASALDQSGALAGTPAVGNALVGSVLPCMTVGTLPAGFSVEAALGPNGLFEVLGGSGDPAGAATSRGAAVFGAEPQTGETWFASAGNKRFLLYGYERDFSFSSEIPASSNAFELSTVPSPIAFSPAIAGGVCQTTTANARLQHVNEILALRTLGFCASSAFAPQQTNGLFAAAIRAADWLLPQKLQAAVAPGGTGSLLSGLSPSGAVTFSSSGVGLTFVQQPMDTKLSANPQFSPSIAVSARTAAGTSVGGIPITLTVNKNRGSFTPPAPVVVTTDVNGVATFTGFYLDKAGGYTLTASGSVFASGTQQVISRLFNISGK